MTPRPRARTVVMTVAALEWLDAGAMQLAAAIFEKRAARRRVDLRGERAFAPAKRRGQDTKRPFRRHLQHHPRAVAGLNGAGRLLDGPPAGARTVARADLACAWVGRRVPLAEAPLALHRNQCSPSPGPKPEIRATGKWFPAELVPERRDLPNLKREAPDQAPPSGIP